MRLTPALALALLCPALVAQTPAAPQPAAQAPAVPEPAAHTPAVAQPQIAPPATVPQAPATQPGDANQLPPSEELKAAAQPLIAARAQPNDLTQADLIAYTVGVGRAGQGCHRLEPAIEDLTAKPEELLALGRLCVYGLQYQLALKAAQRYLQLPNPPDRETAELVITKAFLGLNDTLDAAYEIKTIEKDFPYDTQIHFAIEQDVELGTLAGEEANAEVLTLCADELRNTLPLLETGKALESKEGTITPSALFDNAVRCVDADRDLHDPVAADMLTGTMARLQAILDRPTWQHTAEYAPMQASLARTLQSNQPTPLPAITGKLISNKQVTAAPERPFTLPLNKGTALLIPFTLWSPSVIALVPDLHATAPGQEIYLITSYRANTGNSDKEDQNLLDSLHATARALPEHANVVVVPDETMQQFFADVYPAAVVVSQGKIQANLPLVGEAGKRMTIFALHLPEQTEAGTRGSGTKGQANKGKGTASRD